MTRKRHPAGLYLLAGVEFWERFSYYGLSGLLALFLSAPVADGGHGWSADAATKLVGIYGGLAFAAPALGGYIASRFWSERRCVLIGGLSIMAGHVALSLHALIETRTLDLLSSQDATMIAGLALIVVGTGFLKPAISAVVGMLYPEGGARKDAGFTIFMVCIWAGSLSANLVAGTLGERVGWAWGFGAAALGMAFGLTSYITLAPRLLGLVGCDRPSPTDRAIGFMIRPEERRPIALVACFSALTAVYALAFYQKSGLLTLMVRDEMDRSVGSFTVPATWFLGISTIVFVAAGPMVARLWNNLEHRGRNPDVLQKQAIGLVLIALAYGVLWLLTGVAAEGTRLSAGWMLLVYGLFGAADIFIWPVQISAVTTLAPRRLATMLLGLWWVATGIGVFFTGFVASLAGPLGRGGFFLTMVLCLAVAGVVAILLRPRFSSALQRR